MRMTRCEITVNACGSVRSWASSPWPNRFVRFSCRSRITRSISPPPWERKSPMWAAAGHEGVGGSGLFLLAAVGRHLVCPYPPSVLQGYVDVFAALKQLHRLSLAGLQVVHFIDHRGH